MKRPHSKTADDVLVTDGGAAMRKTIAATRTALTVPKAKVEAMMERAKSKHRRK